MTEPELDGKSLLEALNSAAVSFIIVGGLAVGGHGYPRATKDVDIVPDPDRSNLERLSAVLDELGYEIVGAEELESEEVVKPDLEGLLGGGSWVLRTRFGRLDVLQHLEPSMDFAVLSDEAVDAEVFGENVRLCGYDHLVAMKTHAGRDQDLVDLARLRGIRDE